MTGLLRISFAATLLIGFGCGGPEAPARAPGNLGDDPKTSGQGAETPAKPAGEALTITTQTFDSLTGDAGDWETVSDAEPERVRVEFDAMSWEDGKLRPRFKLTRGSDIFYVERSRESEVGALEATWLRSGSDGWQRTAGPLDSLEVARELTMLFAGKKTDELESAAEWRAIE